MSHTDRNTITARRGSETKIFDARAWAFMVEGGNTSGWEKVTEEPDEIKRLRETKQITTDADGTEVFDHKLTQEDLDNNPELVDEGLTPGEVVQVPLKSDKEAEAAAQAEAGKAKAGSKATTKKK